MRFVILVNVIFNVAYILAYSITPDESILDNYFHFIVAPFGSLISCFYPSLSVQFIYSRAVWVYAQRKDQKALYIARTFVV